ncbi:hypothetical protein EAH89_26890 [Roseomonas nepalensis]|uniref:Uncharacterized protein n=1 Tax=Muricoccus nepalensis TaxID=1854500 RepID=A0A502F6X4_9PROT|nr:hypothetical protein [Roseomonas nepalensis]TPG44831.1 hypothetical protein EAH89_26890 [Roseomonas nepalensis]
MTDFGADIASYGRSGDRKLLGLVSLVSSLAVGIGLYAAVGLAQPTAWPAPQARGAYTVDHRTAGIEGADGQGGAARRVAPGTAAAFHGEG